MEPAEPARLRVWRPLAAWGFLLAAALLFVWFCVRVGIVYRETDEVMHQVSFESVRFGGYLDEVISPDEGVERLGGCGAAASRMLLWRRLRGISSDSQDWSRGGDACWSAAVREMLSHCGQAGVPFLLTEARSPHPAVRRDAIARLGDIREPFPDVVAALIRALGDEDWQVRANAARALGMVRATTASAELAKLFEDSHEYVRFCAKQAFAELQRVGKR